MVATSPQEPSRPSTTEGVELRHEPLRVIRYSHRVVSARALVQGRARFAGQLLQSPSLGFRNQEGDQGPAQHEERKDLHEMVQPGATIRAAAVLRSALVQQVRGDDLGNNSTNLARTRTQTVTRASVARGIAFTGDDEGGGVRAKVKEELCNDIEGEQRTLRQMVVRETDDAEDDGEEEEAEDLDRLATNGVDGGHRSPVSGNAAGTVEDEVANGGLPEHRVDGLAIGEADGVEDDGIVQTEAIEGQI